MVTLAPLNGLVFGGYGYFLRLQTSSPLETPSLWQVTVAGTLTGMLASYVCFDFHAHLGC
jgi:solute carrier family 25 (mitochondrial carnitine/acylcarnitine transporter), member 20/29